MYRMVGGCEYRLTIFEATQFPGVIARPMGSFNGKSDYHYQCVRCNVDLLKLIQIGISLFSEDGEVPPPSWQEMGIDAPNRRYAGRTEPLPHTWQFNFKFSLKEDMYSEVSIESLRQAGVDFAGHERDGIDPFEFAALLISSGLVCDEDVKWISFHGGYDFAYATKLLRCLPLPDDEQEFDHDKKKFFPSMFDIKNLLKHAIKQQYTGQLTNMEPGMAEVLTKFEQKGGIDTLAESMRIKRLGTAQHAGSDSLLTGRIFFRIRDGIFSGEIGEDQIGKVWGLGVSEQPSYFSNTYSTPQHQSASLQENSTPNQNGYSIGAPSTPNTGNARLVHTPSNNNSRGITPMTPGGGGGVFGEFNLGR